MAKNQRNPFFIFIPTKFNLNADLARTRFGSETPTAVLHVKGIKSRPWRGLNQLKMKLPPEKDIEEKRMMEININLSSSFHSRRSETFSTQ